MARIQLPKDFFTKHVWSDEQEPIFDWFASGSGHLAVRARAGCGKTTTLIEGVNRAPERRILMTAFNKSIATELQNRITNRNCRAQTLHALGMYFCSRNIPKLKVDNTNRARGLTGRAIAEVTSKRRLKAILPATEAVTDLHTKIREILVDPVADFEAAQQAATSDVERAELFNTFHEQMEAFALGFGFDTVEAGGHIWPLGSIVEAALLAVKFAKEPTEIIDFADMIFLPLVHDWVIARCDLLVVDEAQDMSKAQLRLAMAATSPEGRICICGDEKQAIYAFRGADSGSLDRLKGELQAGELGLKTTYRCPQKVVQLARRFVPDFQAHDTAPIGNASQGTLASAKAGDFVLSRTNAALVAAWYDLIRQGTPAFIRGRDLCKGLEAILDKVDATGALGLGTLLDRLEKWRDTEVAKFEHEKGKAKEKKIGKIHDQFAILTAFIDGAKTQKEMRDNINKSFSSTTREDAVMLSTVHKAKGLEAEQVFLLGNTFSRADQEEDNICYVAVTRAKKNLFLVGCSLKKFLAGAREVDAAEQQMEGNAPDNDLMIDGW